MAEPGLNRLLRYLRLFVRLSRPQALVGGVLLFALGASIAHYLRYPVTLRSYALGQALVLLIQLMAQYLREYYDAPDDLLDDRRTFLTAGSGALGSGGLPRRTALYAAAACLTLAATLASVLLIHERVSLAAWLILLLGTGTAYFCSAPPLRLATSDTPEAACAR